MFGIISLDPVLGGDYGRVGESFVLYPWLMRVFHGSASVFIHPLRDSTTNSIILFKTIIENNFDASLFDNY